MHHYNSKIFKNRLERNVYNAGKNGRPFYYSAAMFNGIIKRYTPNLVIFDVEPRMLEENYTDYANASDLNPFYSQNELFRKIINQKGFFEPIKMQSYMYKYNSEALPVSGKIFLPDYDLYDGYGPISSKGYDYITTLSNKRYETDTSIDKFTEYLLTQTINKARDENIKIIFSVSPRYQQSNIEEVYSWRYFKDLLKQNNITLIDNADISLIDDPKHYKDAAHLNSDGADIFTEKFSLQIEKDL